MTEIKNLNREDAAEGGCGVLGFAASVPVAGRHLLGALRQMANRGNGKGGGVAIFGLDAHALSVSEEMLRQDYLIQIAYLQPEVRAELEREFIFPYFEVDAKGGKVPMRPEQIKRAETEKDRALPVPAPEVNWYFCRVRPTAIERFLSKNGMHQATTQEVADEFVFQNTYALNKKYYHSLSDKKAFVLSHGKDMMVFKLVGYADDVVYAYGLENFKAHVWIGHHRYPTKGRVWHPGGAHPFIGLHCALIHNGDFSNYHGVSEYLAQRNIFPLFLTDTEVAAYLFDLWRRVYRYPLEYVIEAMAPTTERDFWMLSAEKRRIYREIQVAHIHGSPDGPWFFIVGETEEAKHTPAPRTLRLMGITDTSMLRPQVFALARGQGVQIGLIASERQAIDACLLSLSSDDSRFAAKADLYWNARGGSHSDGGAFIFTIERGTHSPLLCQDKFGREIKVVQPLADLERMKKFTALMQEFGAPQLLARAAQSYSSFDTLCEGLLSDSRCTREAAMEAAGAFTWVLDHWHLSPYNHDGRARAITEAALFEIFRSFPLIEEGAGSAWVRLDWAARKSLRAPASHEKALLLDVSSFPPEGEDSAARLIVAAYQAGWRHIFSFDWRGQRFCGCGLGPNSQGLRIDVYGNPGDYLGSGLDGAHIYVHASAQDQVAQIMKSGKIVIYGDVGQAFGYAAKGGEVYILGNAAGRPLINAVGKPRVVINGTCLDYLAESFMAGDPISGGGFVVINAIAFEGDGRMRELASCYPGSNLMSLASGGAIYLRDPDGQIGEDQLNGGKLVDVGPEDLKLLQPYFEVNETLFKISLKRDLLARGGSSLAWSQVYRKVIPDRANLAV